jgi:hypothetical protein
MTRERWLVGRCSHAIARTRIDCSTRFPVSRSRSCVMFQHLFCRAISALVVCLASAMLQPVPGSTAELVAECVRFFA